MLKFFRSPTSLSCFLLFSLLSLSINAQQHPNLILTQQGVEDIRANLGKVPVFDSALANIQAEVDAEIAAGIDTPVPKDYSGGYTHERHKRNFYMAEKAGLLYQILQDEKYAKYVKDMLFQYEAMYLDLPVHPKPRSYARGKIFWQCLNDSNWLVYMAQAYDTIYNYLSANERKTLEDNLFRPFADFISTSNPQFYNRIHNHSTWGNAAVGMIALVMNDEELLQRALYGLDDDGIEFGTKDDDGGFLKVEGQSAGFLANLEEPFSPEGYFTEGPYYQRYAMYPFLVFAAAMQNNKPEMGVLQHKDNVLMKAAYALINLSDEDGEFFPLNDGQKGMSYLTSAVVTVVNMAYLYGGEDPSLLSVAQEQNTVLLDQSGLAVALAIQNGKAKPYNKLSVNYGDGPNGEQGGVAVLRADNSELVFKYSAQGLSHGHYDKLSFSLYDGGNEVLQDYGLSRFVNIEKKGGGNYLKENKTWAKQTIAHNTLTQDETSHFSGKYEIGSQHHSNLYFYESESDRVQVISATEQNAYPGTKMHRTMVMLKDEAFGKPFVLDIFKVKSNKTHQYDLPFYFLGQVLDTSFDYASGTPEVLGAANGYQHLYVEAKAESLPDGTAQFDWLENGKYYTLTTTTEKSDDIMFTRIGANDPNFNLRREAAFMTRRKAKDTVFVSVIEPHGAYSPVTELSQNANSNVKSVSVVHDSDDYTAVEITTHNAGKRLFIISNKDASVTTKHRLKLQGKTYKWNGTYLFVAE